MDESGRLTDPVVLVELFATPLGWMAIIGSQKGLRRLTFGHRSPGSARRASDPDGASDMDVGHWHASLAERLQAYAGGQPTEFDDIQLDLGRATQFQREVTKACRQIPWGQVATYGQLAARAGTARAARAVGRVMATNPVPLVVPCHRVIAAGGRLGGFSAPQGTAMKRRLLQLEGVEL